MQRQVFRLAPLFLALAATNSLASSLEVGDGFVQCMFFQKVNGAPDLTRPLLRQPTGALKVPDSSPPNQPVGSFTLRKVSQVNIIVAGKAKTKDQYQFIDRASGQCFGLTPRASPGVRRLMQTQPCSNLQGTSWMVDIDTEKMWESALLASPFGRDDESKLITSIAPSTVWLGDKAPVVGDQTQLTIWQGELGSGFGQGLGLNIPVISCAGPLNKNTRIPKASDFNDVMRYPALPWTNGDLIQATMPYEILGTAIAEADGLAFEPTSPEALALRMQARRFFPNNDDLSQSYRNLFYLLAASQFLDQSRRWEGANSFVSDYAALARYITENLIDNRAVEAAVNSWAPEFIITLLAAADAARLRGLQIATPQQQQFALNGAFERLELEEGVPGGYGGYTAIGPGQVSPGQFGGPIATYGGYGDPVPTLSTVYAGPPDPDSQLTWRPLVGGKTANSVQFRIIGQWAAELGSEAMGLRGGNARISFPLYGNSVMNGVSYPNYSAKVGSGNFKFVLTIEYNAEFLAQQIKRGLLSSGWFVPQLVGATTDITPGVEVHFGFECRRVGDCRQNSFQLNFITDVSFINAKKLSLYQAQSTTALTQASQALTDDLNPQRTSRSVLSSSAAAIRGLFRAGTSAGSIGTDDGYRGFALQRVIDVARHQVFSAEQALYQVASGRSTEVASYDPNNPAVANLPFLQRYQAEASIHGKAFAEVALSMLWMNPEVFDPSLGWRSGVKWSRAPLAVSVEGFVSTNAWIAAVLTGRWPSRKLTGGLVPIRAQSNNGGALVLPTSTDNFRKLTSNGAQAEMSALYAAH